MKCKFCVYLLAITIAILLILPTPKDFSIATVQVPQVTPLEKLGIPLDVLQKGKLLKLPAKGPEDIEIDREGFAYTALTDGSLIKINLNTEEIQVLVKFESESLGIALSPSQNHLAVVNMKEGLVLFDLKNKTWESIVSISEQIMNSVVFQSEEMIYYTVSGVIPMDAFHEELLYKTDLGKVYSYDRRTKEKKVFASNIYFANGITYSKADNCLYVVELNQYRILQFSLAPETYAQRQIVYTAKSFYMDNIKIADDGNIWVGTPSLRDHVNNLVDRYPILRKLILNIRMSLHFFMSLANFEYSGGVKVDPHTHEVVEHIYGQLDQFIFSTVVKERDEIILVGSRVSEFLVILDREKIPVLQKQQLQDIQL